MTQPDHASPGHELVPAARRPAALIVIGLCVITVCVIGAVVANGSTPTGLDTAVWNALPYPWAPGGQFGHQATLLQYLNTIRQLGGPIPVIFLTALLCYCCLAMRRYRGALMLAAGEIGASAFTEVTKPLFNRTIGGSLSYPSGHTTAAFALAIGVVLLLAFPPDNRMPASLRVVLSLVAVGTATLVAIGMVAWHQHYFTDTIGGAAVGTGATLAAALVIDYVADRRRRAAAPAPAAQPEQPSEVAQLS
jgi:membrane-associated phospholipid phosphatase